MVSTSMYFTMLLAMACQVHCRARVDRPSATALTKVVSMLTDMANKGVKDMQDEQVEYGKFTVYCSQETENYKKGIKKQGETIEKVSADIGVLESEITQLGKDIVELGAKIEEDSASLKDARAERKTGRQAYLAESTDYGESVDAIASALIVLGKQDYDRTGKEDEVLLQVSSRKGVPRDAQTMIKSFLELGSKHKELAPPEANAYEFQSGSVITMLKHLSEEFKSKLTDCQQKEMNSQHAFEMIVTDLQSSIELTKKNRAEKVSSKAQKEESIATLQHLLATTETDKADDEKSVQDLEVACKTKGSSFAYKQQLRKDEILAINQALSILGGKPVELGAEHLESVRIATALAQFLAASRSKTLSGSEAQSGFQAHTGSQAHSGSQSQSATESKSKNAQDRQRVRDFLSKEGARLHSKSISLLAEKLQADPFANIKELLEKMVTKLMNEAHADSEKAGFCDVEVGKSKITRTKLTQDIDALSSELESTKATIIMLGEEIASTQEEVKELQEAMKQATALRQSESANNKAKIAESKEAGAAVEKATMVLKEFYEMASSNTASAETRSVNPKMGTAEWEALGTKNAYTPEPRATFGKVFTGQQETAGGVVALLEVIQSDFATVVTTTEQAEADAKKTYDDLMAEMRKNVSTKERGIEMSESDRVEEESKQVSVSTNLKATQKEMAAADDYWENLKPQCLDQGTTFENRQKQIQQEIDSLKEAFALLGGELSADF